MASLTPAAVQNENLHIHRGKGVEGSKFGDIQNENLHILKGKSVDGTKSGIVQNENLRVLKGKAGRQERKALKDLKPNKSTCAIREAIRETATKKAQKSNFLTYEEILEEIPESREWGKQVEYKQSSSVLDFCSEMDEAIFGSSEWTDMSPVKEVPSDSEDTFPLKFVMEVLPPTPPRARKPSYEEILKLLELDYADLIYLDTKIDFKLKEEDEDD